MQSAGKKSELKRIRSLLALSLLSIVLTVALGTFWMVTVVDELGSHARSRASQVLLVEEALSAASDAMANQTQEWKDMLLRMQDAELLAHHRQGFEREQAALRVALQRAEFALVNAGMRTDEVQGLRQRHRKLIEKYQAALEKLDPSVPLSYREVDRQVRGEDRAMRDALHHLRSLVAVQARMRVSSLGVGDTGGTWRYYWLGLMGIGLPLLSFVLFYLAYRALRRLGNQDARIRAIYEAIGDGVVVVDMQGRIDSLNETAQRMSGWSAQQAQGQPLTAVIPVFDVQGRSVDTPIAQVLRDGRMVPMSNGMILRSRDGKEYAIEDSAAPVRDEQGTMLGVVMVFHDVSPRYELMREVRRERELFSQTFDLAAVGMAHLSPDGSWSRVNRKLCEITGYSEAELLHLSFGDITHPDDLGRDLDKLQDLIAGRIDSYRVEKRYIRKNGSIVWVGLALSIVWKADGTVDYGISIIEDIEARKDAERAALAARQQYQALFEQMPEGVLLVNQNLRVLSCNQEALSQLGYQEDALLERHIWEIDAAEDEATVKQRAANIRLTGKDEYQTRYRTAADQLIEVNVSVRLAHLPDGDEVFQYLFRDISEQTAAALKIEHLAYHDQLTGLANRRLLNDRIEQAVSGALRRHAPIALLFLDLDHFKNVNDSLGHQFGDALLKVVAVRLQQCIRNEDTLSRIGGDEFVIMLNDLASLDDAALIARKIIQQVGLPIRIGEEEVRITPSIGISVCPQDGKDADTLLKNADAALYQAKAQGRATYRFFTAQLHEQSVERLRIERMIRLALERNEFELYYQPKVRLADGCIIGCEALIRWNHPEQGLMPPDQFIPIAEQSQLIVEIGEWVMHEACHQAARWHRHGYDFQVAFNVSARQFMRPQELLVQMHRALSDSGVSPARMEIEMTESLLLDPQGMGEVLQQLSAMGMVLALDDFGTGYSSLSYLRRFPISILKIDRSFVSDADSNPDDAEMVKTIIGMAHNLRMKLVAEGIETESQRALLATQGCETGQGYLFSRPLPAAEFEAFMDKR